MKLLRRNLTPMYYALYTGQEEIMDGTLHTFEYRNTYSAWTPINVSVTPSRGSSEAELFGVDVQYDKVVTTDDMDCPIDEATVLCLDVAPVDGVFQYDYIVTKVAKSLNFIQYAVRKVDVEPRSIEAPNNGISDNDNGQPDTDSSED